MDNLEIRFGLPGPLFRPAAHLICEAFQRKIGALVATPEPAVAMLSMSLNPAVALVALIEGQLAGLASLEYDGQHPVRARPGALIRQFGPLRGLLGWLVLSHFNQPTRPHEMRIALLAVRAALRGRGVGTRLLEGALDYARQRGDAAVRLEVVDTNPRAHHLYERMGFVAVKTQRYPFARDWMGFSAAISMVKRLQGQSNS